MSYNAVLGYWIKQHGLFSWVIRDVFIMLPKIFSTMLIDC